MTKLSEERNVEIPEIDCAFVILLRVLIRDLQGNPLHDSRGDDRKEVSTLRNCRSIRSEENRSLVRAGFLIAPRFPLSHSLYSVVLDSVEGLRESCESFDVISLFISNHAKSSKVREDVESVINIK